MLDSQVQAMLDRGKAAGVPDLFDLPPVEAREVYLQLLTSLDVKPADVAMEDRQISGPSGPLRLRIYRPGVETAGPCGVVLYLHGGGFVVGSPGCYEGLCSTLCEAADCVVIQVDYRLAPEHPFPAAVEDCCLALEWACANAGDLGADSSRVAVAGDSAGANLAAVIALLARDRPGPVIRHQLLIYPVVAPAPGRFSSYAKYGENLILTTRGTLRCHRYYFDGAAVAPDFRGAPLLARDLADLPPALILVAGYDVLHDEGVAYADRLAGAGNAVALVEYATLPHGFISMGGVVDTARLAVDQVCMALRRALAP